MEHERQFAPLGAQDLTDEQGQVIAEIEAYCEAVGLAPSTFGQRAIGDREVIRRLERYRERTRDVAARCREFMRANPPEKRRQAS